jgi:hypothetical protein
MIRYRIRNPKAHRQLVGAGRKGIGLAHFCPSFDVIFSEKEAKKNIVVRHVFL